MKKYIPLIFISIFLILMMCQKDTNCDCYAYSKNHPEKKPIYYSDDCATNGIEVTINFDGKIIKCELKSN